MNPYQWVWQYIRVYKKRLGLALFLCAIATAMSLVNPYISGLVVEKVFQQGHFDNLAPLLAIMIVVTLCKTCIRYTFLLLTESASQHVQFNIRQDVYRRVQDQTFTFFDENKVGDVLSRLIGDLEAIRHFVAYVIYGSFENILTFVVALVVMFTISWQLALLMFLVAPVIAVSAYRQATEIKPAFTKNREQFAKLNAVCQENISGNRVVKAFAQESYEIQKFRKENQDYMDANIQGAVIWIKYLPIMEFCAGLLFVVMMLAGGILVITGHLQLWQLVIFNGYIWAINNPLRMVGWLINDIQRFAASSDKICDVMRKGVLIQNPQNQQGENIGLKPNRLRGKVEFRNVSFAYDPTKPHMKALEHISFVAEPGFTVGIVGATGAGKTSIIHLIGRFYDVTEGQVLVDDVDVKEYDLQHLRRGIASAMQDVFLFSDTVEGNIAYGVPDAPMERVKNAATVADADGFICKMESGYDTIVGERGVGLSGGQRQRIALARAIAVDPSILILDDTTSAVDMETEHAIQKALKEQYSDRTKFIIAHRISSVKSADLILVLDNGKIIEAGTHHSLVAQKGYYHELFHIQYADLMDFATEGVE